MKVLLLGLSLKLLLLGDECVLGLDCVAGVFLGCVVVVVLAVVGTFIF